MDNTLPTRVDITPIIARYPIPTDRILPQIPSRLYNPRPNYVSQESRINHTLKRQKKMDSRKSNRAALTTALNLEKILELRNSEIFTKADNLLLDIYSLGTSIIDIDFAYIEQTRRGQTTEELYLGVTDESGHVYLYSGPAVEAAREEIKKYALKLKLDNSA